MPSKQTSKTDQTSQQAQTSSNTIDPTQLGQFNANLTHAQGAANSLTPYTGQMVAGFSPNQTQAQGILSGIATNPSYGNNIQGAVSGAQGVLGNPVNGQVNPQSVSPSMISPQNITGAPQVSMQSVSASPITAGLLKNTDLSPYENPYTKDVINASIDQNERARQMATVSDAQRATAAGAFGGSRSGVAASLTNGEYDRNSQANIANLNAANFGQAQSAATGDINRTLGADQFNSGQKFAADQFNSTGAYNAGIFNAGQDQATKQFNAGQDYNAQIANQNAGINTGEYNAGQGLTAQQQSISNAMAGQGLSLNAAGQVVDLSNQGLNTDIGQANLLSSVGGQQQAQQQAELAAAYQAYTQGQQLTLAQQQMLNQALGMIPIQQTTNSSGNSSGTSTSQTTTNPGLGSILGGLGSLGMGVGSMASGGLFGSVGGGSSGGGLFGMGGLFGSSPTFGAPGLGFGTVTPNQLTGKYI